MQLRAIVDQQRVGRNRPPCAAVIALGWLAIASMNGAALAAYPPASDSLLADCDSPDFARVLEPAIGRGDGDRRGADSRAYWIDGNLLKWPGARDDGSVYRLVASTHARLAIVGDRIRGADREIPLAASKEPLPTDQAERFKFVAEGVLLRLAEPDRAKLASLLRGQSWLVREDSHSRVLDATAVQNPGVLDALYGAAQSIDDLGIRVAARRSTFKLWAPTAQAVNACLYEHGHGRASGAIAMLRDERTGAWSANLPRDLSGSSYRYLVDVFVPGLGIVRNRVTDPYSISLDSDSRRSYIADPGAASLLPVGWSEPLPTAKVLAQTDMVIYELHVRDFSINDDSVPAAHRGKYLAFTDAGSRGMQHLRALSTAGLTDIHLLPVFDFASVPETGCRTPRIDSGTADGESQQLAVSGQAGKDCFNWGYDPFHFNAPEGSYATDADDGAVRILEFRRMVQALHRAGLRVGMDVVYNHTTASGQKEQSVLDRIVPGYYHRLDGNGVVERSTCCDNTATEHLMMGKLMIDSAVLWATQYRIDSFRFDLMAHQPRSVMEALGDAVDRATGRHVNLIGEGWNFGEVANGARFVQASQLSLGGSGIGTFSDRARDAVRGGKASDSGESMLSQQGYINGLVYAANDHAPRRPQGDLMQAADMVRVGLAGSIRDFPLQAWDGETRELHEIAYGDQPAGYAAAPGEVVNYIENHDNQTLFDINAYKLPRETAGSERARVQVLGAAINAFSQGVAYFHAGIDTLRSKSLDRNSFDSGDWFNRIDWSYRENYFGTGLPPRQDNGKDYALMAPLLVDAGIRPTPADIAFTRDAFRDLLRIRASSALFRLDRAAAIKQRLSFPNSGPSQNPVVLAGHLDGSGLPRAGFRELLYLVNVDTRPQLLTLPSQAGKAYRLHPVHLAAGAADPRPAKESKYQAASGTFTVPARTALVYVLP